MEVGCEAAETLYRFGVAVCRYGHVMFCASHIDPRCIHIQGRKSFGRIHFPGSLLPSFAWLLRAFWHRVIPPTEIRRTRPGCESVYESLQRGRASRSKSADCHQLTEIGRASCREGG